MNDKNKLKTIEYWNTQVINMSAVQRVEWSMKNLPSNRILSSSFGTQSVVMLHMITQIDNSIPIIIADTGHLFPETYQYIEQLTADLQLNLHIYQAKLSTQEQIEKYGKLWEKGDRGIQKHYYLNKVEPFERAMSDLNAQTWFSGVRSQQSSYREKLEVIEPLRNHIKVHPIIDWSDIDIDNYIKKYNLPIHPLSKKGYKSIGDIHNTNIASACNNKESVRFCDEKRECGLHTATTLAQ